MAPKQLSGFSAISVSAVQGIDTNRLDTAWIEDGAL
jgi:hypothetical protein